MSLDLLFLQDEDVHMSLMELWGTNTGKATLICEALAVLAMTPFVIIELSTMAAYDLWGWINLWNALDIATYALQVGGCICCQRNVHALVCRWVGHAPLATARNTGSNAASCLQCLGRCSSGC